MLRSSTPKYKVAKFVSSRENVNKRPWNQDCVCKKVAALSVANIE